MHITYWVFTIITAIVFLGAGLMKLVRPKEALYKMGLHWTEDFSQKQIKLLATAEFLGGLGVLLPPLTGIALFLAPVAAGALLILMIGATATHLNRKEPPFTIGLIILTLVTMVLAIVSVVS